jgi:hypothetical protein
MRSIPDSRQPIRRFTRRGRYGLFCRLGPVNAQKQTHRGSHPAPASRGLWAFPAGFFSPFYAPHPYYQLMPKRIRRFHEDYKKTKGWRQRQVKPGEPYPPELYAEEQLLLRQAKRQLHLSRFWYAGGLWAKFPSLGEVEDDRHWYWHADVPSYLAAARKYLPRRWRCHPAEHFSYRTMTDHYWEVFIPMDGQRSARQQPSARL